MDFLMQILGVNTVIVTTPIILLTFIASIPFIIVRILAKKDWQLLSKDIERIKASDQSGLLAVTPMGKRWIIANWRRRHELNEWYVSLSLAIAASPSVSIVWALASEENTFYLNWIGLTLALVITFASLIVFSSITSTAFRNSHLLGRLSKDMKVSGYLTVSKIIKIDDKTLNAIKISLYDPTPTATQNGLF